jgi:OOP family OmpA-OmpF porin
MRDNRCRAALAGVAVIASAALLAACAGRSGESLEEARARVAAARADSGIVGYAPDKLEEAEQTLARTESAFDAAAPQVEVDHLAYLTMRRVAIADALAGERAALAEIEELGREQGRLAVESRDRHIDSLESQLAELQAQQTERGLVVTLSDILFDVDRAQLTPGGELQVVRLADVLQQMPERNLLIEGHTDSTGSDSYNDELSQRRADAVEDLLIIQGIEPTRVVTRGYGERFPVATNDTAAGRQQNRRVEIVILNPGDVDAPRATLPPRATLQ